MPLSPKRLLVAASVLAVAAAGGAGMALASDGSEAAAGGAFVPLEDVVVPIVSSDRVEGTLRVRMVVETADEAAVSERLPELRAASLAAAVEHSRLYASALAPVNAEQLGGDMTAALKQANPAVGRVLLTEVGAFAI
ncbi:hypothetical protein E2493_16885 [Sphingomonas parva]|uniref:Uncharacterized protein n=1 Tax=Sphingomonas parva TaxID=2555898 RepID=A0A4Y8ZRS1_9SPHN|nr:hypothetical protein [Sphingomonas parva]TFI57106.1 hypothetical protein E2493_16885 [Sphingomonas parva]